MNDSDDDDYELPSLAERIQASLKTSSMVKPVKTFDKDSEESEFLQISEKIHSSLGNQVKLKFSDSSDGENKKLGFAKSPEKVQNVPYSEVNLKLHFSSSSSDDSDSGESKCLKLSEKIPSASQSQCELKQDKREDSENDVKLSNLAEKIGTLKLSKLSIAKEQYVESDSDSDGTFSNSIAKFREINTPKSQIKKQHNIETDSDSDGTFSNSIAKFREINNPKSQIKKQHFIVSDSDSDGTFSNSIAKFREINTPKSQIKKQHCIGTDSDSDGTFSNSTAKCRKINTPKSQNKKLQYVESDSDSDGTFSKSIAKFREMSTPKSQNMYNKESSSHTHSIKKQSLPNTSDSLGGQSTISKDLPESSMGVQAKNKKEYDSLFPSKSDDSLFYKKRAFYTKALFEFFNRKIFDYQLPKDMSVIWDESLIKTAGLTYCKATKNVYSCSIKLSSKLLTSFDRLQDTLLHEMCHAAVWIINRQNVGHGPLWQLWASRSKLILPFIDCPARCHSYDVPYRFWYKCPSCNWKRGTCRRIKKYNGALCIRCKIPIILIVNG